jgi:PEGA domain
MHMRRHAGRSSDELPTRNESMSGFSWPPGDDEHLATEVLDGAPRGWQAPAATSTVAPEPLSHSTSPVVSELPATTQPALRATRERMSSRTAHIAIAVLACLAIAEGIFIGTGLQLTRTDAAAPTIPSAPDGAFTAPAALPAAEPHVGAAPPQVSSLLGSSPEDAAVASALPRSELRIRTDQPKALVLIDGRPRGTAPLTINTLAPGRHRVRLVAGKSSVEDTVVMEAGVTTSLVLRMASSTPAVGWVDVVTPFDVNIFEEGRLVGTSAQPRLQFPAGEHRFVLVSEALGYRALEPVRVLPGEVSKLQPQVPVGVLSVNALPWAEVWIDGRPSGTTPLGAIKVPIGTHEIRFRHPEFGDQTRQVMVTTREPTRVGVEFKR